MCRHKGEVNLRFSASGFWIGKYSLRSWNKIWEEKQRIEEEKDLDEEVAATKQSEEPAEIQENAQCSESEFEFNHDLLCKEHGSQKVDFLKMF